jgi:hypothetical protein
MKKTTTDPTFGALTHLAGDLWQRTSEFALFDVKRAIPLMISISPKNGVEPDQVSAYKYFVENTPAVVSAAEQGIFDYYCSICGQYRSQFRISDPNDKRFPIVKTKAQVARLITLEAVIFPYVRRQPTFGILCQCTWEEERGLAVKFSDGKMVGVGFQDIVI